MHAKKKPEKVKLSSLTAPSVPPIQKQGIIFQISKLIHILLIYQYLISVVKKVTVRAPVALYVPFNKRCPPSPVHRSLALGIDEGYFVFQDKIPEFQNTRKKGTPYLLILDDALFRL